MNIDGVLIDFVVYKYEMQKEFFSNLLEQIKLELSNNHRMKTIQVNHDS